MKLIMTILGWGWVVWTLSLGVRFLVNGELLAGAASVAAAVLVAWLIMHPRRGGDIR